MDGHVYTSGGGEHDMVGLNGEEEARQVLRAQERARVQLHMLGLDEVEEA